MAMSCWLVGYLLVSKPLLLIKHTYQGRKKKEKEKDMKREGKGGLYHKSKALIMFFHQAPFKTPSSHS
jgi:hypothetical protein